MAQVKQVDDNKTTRATRRRRSVQGEVEEELAALARLKYPPVEIHRRIVRKYGEARTPTLRTIQRYVRASQDDDVETWNVVTASAEEAALVVPVLGYIAWATAGRIKSFSKDEARWVAKVLRIAPDLKPEAGSNGLPVFLLALDYAERERSGEPTDDLDLFLGIAPWREGVAPDYWRHEYERLVGDGLIPAARHGRFLNADAFRYRPTDGYSEGEDEQKG